MLRDDTYVAIGTRSYSKLPAMSRGESFERMLALLAVEREAAQINDVKQKSAVPDGMKCPDLPRRSTV